MTATSRRAHFAAAMAAARTARTAGDVDAAWHALEQAHILGQPWIGPHLRAHGAMLALALGRRMLRETFGQLFRISLVIPGTLLGRLPAGNTGRASVGAFRPMPVPDDLQRLLQDRE